MHLYRARLATGRRVETLNPLLRWVRVPRDGWPNGAPALLVQP